MPRNNKRTSCVSTVRRAALRRGAHARGRRSGGIALSLTRRFSQRDSVVSYQSHDRWDLVRHRVPFNLEQAPILRLADSTSASLPSFACGQAHLRGAITSRPFLAATRQADAQGAPASEEEIAESN